MLFIIRHFLIKLKTSQNFQIGTMTNLVKIFICVFTICLTKGTIAKPIPFTDSDLEKVETNIRKIIEFAQFQDLFSKNKDEFIAKVTNTKSSAKDQFVQAMETYKKTYQMADSPQATQCQFRDRKSILNIIDILDEIVNVTTKMTNEEFEHVLDEITSTSPKLVYFYHYGLEKKDSSEDISEFFQKFITQMKDFSIDDLKEMKKLSEVPIEDVDFEHELAKLFYELDHARFQVDMAENLCLVDLFPKIENLLQQNIITKFQFDQIMEKAFEQIFNSEMKLIFLMKYGL